MIFSLKDRARKKFAEAIDAGDLKAMQKLLSHNAERLREINYMTYQRADFDNGRSRIPEQKFSNPIALAKHRNFTAGLELMQKFGFPVPAEYLTPQKPRYGMEMKR